MGVIIFIFYAFTAGGIWYLITGLHKRDKENNSRQGCIICIILGILAAISACFLD